MNRLLIILPVLVANLITAFKMYAQPSPTDSALYSMQLMHIEQRLMDGIAVADTMLWKRYLTNDFFIVTEDGSRLSRKEFLAGFRPLPKGYSGYIKVIKPKFVFRNNTGVISYVADEYEVIFGQKLHTTYGVMDTYIRNDSIWQMISSQVYEIPQLPSPVQIDPKIMQKYAGTYQLSDSNNCVVTVEHDTLFLQKTNRKKIPLFAETENVFFTPADTRGRKIFTTDDHGNMTLQERRNGNDVVWKKIN